jgi:hypothetical protein
MMESAKMVLYAYASFWIPACAGMTESGCGNDRKGYGNAEGSGGRRKGGAGMTERSANNNFIPSAKNANQREAILPFSSLQASARQSRYAKRY